MRGNKMASTDDTATRILDIAQAIAQKHVLAALDATRATACLEGAPLP